jgi:hypothetical protein
MPNPEATLQNLQRVLSTIRSCIARQWRLNAFQPRQRSDLEENPMLILTPEKLFAFRQLFIIPDDVKYLHLGWKGQTLQLNAWTISDPRHSGPATYTWEITP